MPWTGPSFGKHNHSLTSAQSSHAARIANAVKRRGVDDGESIAIANKYFQKHDDGGVVDPAAGEIGGPVPTSETMNPMHRGMYLRYGALSPEKLQEMAVGLGASPQGQIIRQILQQKRLAATTEQTPEVRGYRSGGTAQRAPGGGMSMAQAFPSWTRSAESQESSGTGASGYLHGSTPGRADKILTTAPAGAYVIPADVVSGLGEGNSLAGAGVMERIIQTGPHGIKMPARSGVSHGPPRAPGLYREAAGGGIDAQPPQQRPVALSHGEYVVDPHHVIRFGGGNKDAGIKWFDAWVIRQRKKIIAKMKSLPGPVGAKKK